MLIYLGVLCVRLAGWCYLLWVVICALGGFVFCRFAVSFRFAVVGFVLVILLVVLFVVVWCWFCRLVAVLPWYFVDW